MCASNSTLFDPNKKIPFKKAPLLMLALRWTPNFFGSIACWGRYLAGCEIWSNIFARQIHFWATVSLSLFRNQKFLIWFSYCKGMANSEMFSLTISSSINPLFLKRGVLMLCEIYHYRQYFLTKKVQTEEAKMKRKLKFVQNICFSATKLHK